MPLVALVASGDRTTAPPAAAAAAAASAASLALPLPRPVLVGVVAALVAAALGSHVLGDK